jgi:hypothetical protein
MMMPPTVQRFVASFVVVLALLVGLGLWHSTTAQVIISPPPGGQPDGGNGATGPTGPSGPAGPTGPEGAFPCTFVDPDMDCSTVDVEFNSVVVGDGSGSLPLLIAAGAEALDTDEIASEACDVSSVTATGTLTTDVIIATLNGTPIGVTGYVPSTDGTLYAYVYPTADAVNISVCNQTAGAITPGALTVNWMVLRSSLP